MELLTDLKIIPTGEQLRMMENVTSGSLQSTCPQLFEGEHATCNRLCNTGLLLIWSLMFFMALQRSGDGAGVGGGVSGVLPVEGVAVWGDDVEGLLVVGWVVGHVLPEPAVAKETIITIIRHSISIRTQTRRKKQSTEITNE